MLGRAVTIRPVDLAGALRLAAGRVNLSPIDSHEVHAGADEGIRWIDDASPHALAKAPTG